MIIGLFTFGSWAHGAKIWLFVALLGFISIILLSSVWMPYRFKRVAQQLHGLTAPARADRTLVALELARGALLICVGAALLQLL